MIKKTTQTVVLKNGKEVQILSTNYTRYNTTHWYKRKDVLEALGLEATALDMYDMAPSEHDCSYKPEPTGDPMAYITATALLLLPEKGQRSFYQRELIIELLRLNLVDTN